MWEIFLQANTYWALLAMVLVPTFNPEKLDLDLETLLLSEDKILHIYNV